MDKKKPPLDPDGASEKELTDKFLNGELSFTEYSERWSGKNEDEDEDNDGEEDEASGETEADNEPKASGAKGVKLKRPRRHLTPALSGLMGEANLRYARGELDAAEKMCYEIIRQVPTAYEPFQTLAQIFEGDPERSLQFMLVAAHLNPSDSDQWIKLAEISESRNDLKQAVSCYTKAINADQYNLTYHLARYRLVKSMCDSGVVAPGQPTPTLCLLRSMKCYPDTEGPTVVNIAKTVARSFHSTGEISKACDAMERAYRRFPQLFSPEELNLYIELLIGCKEYDKCLDVFIKRCEVEIETEVQFSSGEPETETVSSIVKCSVPSGLQIDLKANLIICLIHLKSSQVIEPFLDDIIENEDVSNMGDIYLDIEEALTQQGYHVQALRLLRILISSPNFSLPAVWLKYAECLLSLDYVGEAVKAYKTVVEQAPQHIDARIKLASLLIKNDLLDDALFYLEQDEKGNVLDTSLLYEKCKLLKLKEELEEYVQTGYLLLSRNFYVVRSKEELNAFRSRDTFESLKLLREARGEECQETNRPVFEDSIITITPQMEWELFLDLLNVTYDLKKFNFMERLVYSALSYKRFYEHKSILDFYCLLACYYNKDSVSAMKLVRELFFKGSDKIGIWNFLNLIMQRASSSSHNKFIVRLARHLKNVNMRMLYGNYSLTSGTYKYALNEYVSCFKSDPSPLSALLVAVTMTHMGTQRFTTKHNLVTLCFAFFSEYKRLRGSGAPQEVYYNIGRAYHQLGLVHLATQYYKRALAVKNLVSDEDNPQLFDLTRDIAYNLHLIYLETAPDIAIMYIENYIVID